MRVRAARRRTTPKNSLVSVVSRNRPRLLLAAGGRTGGCAINPFLLRPAHRILTADPWWRIEK